MKTQLDHLRKLISEDLNPLRKLSLSPAESKAWLVRLPGITEALFIAIRHEVYGTSADRLIERHIRQTQGDCIYLMDILQRYRDIPDPLLALHKAAFNCLEEILTYIEQYHSCFFDLQAMIPVSYFKASSEDLRQKMSRLKAGLKKWKVDDLLQKLLLAHLTNFTASEGCTYEQLIYMKHLQGSLIELCDEAGDGDFNALITEHLLYLRFNAKDFSRYYKTKIAGEVSELYDVQQQFEKLCMYEKQLKVQQEKACSSFEPRHINLRCSLLDYVKAELKYLRKRQDYSVQHTAPADLNRRLSYSGYRIKLSLSADALAYLTRLFVEAGVIVANPRTELMQFIARSVETPGIGTSMLSAKSLLTKYKQVVQSTVKSVRAALMRMLKLLDLNYGIG